MSALKKQKFVSKDINLVYDLSEKPNLTQLKAHKDRAVIAHLRADLVLPTDKIMTVDISFDTVSGFHNNAIMVMDEFGVEMIATAFTATYGQQHGDKVRTAWAQKQQAEDPRKPTYLLVQRPRDETSLPQVYAICGGQDHLSTEAPDSVI